MVIHMKNAKKFCALAAACAIAGSLFLSACTANNAEPGSQSPENTAPEGPTASATVKSIEIAQPPNKVDYLPGEELDDTGAIVNAIMSDGTVIENVAYTVELGTVSKTTRAMIFSYEGKTVYQMLNIMILGNAEEYSVANTPSDPNSPIAGKKLYFLGSSVTFGAHSDEEAIPEFMDKVYGTVSIKEARSGTTLAISKEPRSYVERFDEYLESPDRAETMDCVIVQLSTNDTSKVDNLGQVMPSFLTDPEGFDKNTTFGAIEYIIARAKQTWDCPIVFYTNTPYGLDRYGEMVDGLYKAAEKWDITVIDLYYDEEFNDIPAEDYALYMADVIHPTKAGYRDWWLPKFYECLSSVLLDG